MYAISAKEKRLRRRLWWATYIEDKWISLLLGRPPHIQHEECDVSHLTEIDFQVSGISGAAGNHAFQDMSRLALIAKDLQASLYSLRACQTLAEDPVALLQAAKPIFDDLNTWRSDASAPEPFHPECHLESGNYPITVYFAYLMLGLYVWRAAIRSGAVSLPAPYVIDADEQHPQSEQMQDGTALSDSLTIDLDAFPNIDLPNIEWASNDDGTNSSMLAKELYQAAQAWAENLVEFVWQMSLHKVDEFWHSWSRVSFTVISTFLITILVQAPSLQDASRAKKMLAKWRRTVSRRSKVSDLFSPAMTQLNTIGADVTASFYLPHHVQQALRHEDRAF
ncbi:fungal specific transcription factor [Stagonosporopsis vannaccii]|nr:fungal specific transcription factor [Stagonosporopsis vannaccii]